MSQNTKSQSYKQKTEEKKKRFLFIGASTVTALVLVGVGVLTFADPLSVQYSRAADASTAASSTEAAQASVPAVATLDKVAYDAKLLSNANYATTSSSTASSTAIHHLWPVKTVYPNGGALLPFHRIVAYYGNFYSTKMGILGQNPPSVMIPQLNAEVAKWNAADPTTSAIPAIDYIAITAQGSAGADGKYRARMPDSQIQEAITLAKQVNGIVILDLQVGLSNVQTEIPLLKQYIALPNVELALDPEFSMKDGAKPGSEIGTMDATDINYTSNYMAAIVKANNLPPKILVVHRFTQKMVTHYKNITPLPEVQIVMDMDGWGSPAKKINTYQQFVQLQPVQFTGFKLFYKNDLKPPSTRMLTDAELLKLSPRPLFIQYQ
jgi:hypothetical protein